MRSTPGQLPPFHAIAVHLEWKLALAQAVQSGMAANLDPDALAKADRCELGLWLQGSLACTEGSEDLRRVHGQFHALAGQLVRRLQANEPAADVLDRLEDLSADLVNRLGSAAQADAEPSLAAV